MKRLFRIMILVTLLILLDVSAAQGNSLPDSAYISGVSGHAQGYNLSCEARSAVDLAAFWGIDIGETEFLQALPHSDNPEKGFVGDPNEAWGNIPPHGYGVHASPVADTLKSYGLDAIGLSNLSWNDVRGQINEGDPVIVWIIGEMWNGTAVEYASQDGGTALVAAYEHTMLLTGYNQNTVQVIDAYTGQVRTYALDTFLKSWEVLGNMAVFASLNASQQSDTPPETQADTYTVQPGDYLIQLAKQFDSSWLELAQLNSIDFPYVIHPGQVLRLPARPAPAVEPASVPEAAAPAEPATAVVEPPSVDKVVNFQARLPFVQRNYAAPPMAPPFVNGSPSSEAPQPVIASGSSVRATIGDTLRVNWQLLVRLKDLLLPYLIHPGEVLKLK